LVGYLSRESSRKLELGSIWEDEMSRRVARLALSAASFQNNKDMLCCRHALPESVQSRHAGLGNWRVGHGKQQIKIARRGADAR